MTNTTELGKTDEKRQAAYRLLFRTRIAQKTVEKRRRATKAPEV
ncbi:hypothetical protein [Nitrococcus mobilis]|nr:hypothetical protein [Nitrococcus mobilis]